MPSNVLPLTIQGTALPPTVAWSPQELADFVWSKARIVTSASYALFVTGSTEPSSNVGPWLKDGTTWYVWSDSLGQYIPQTIEPESLGYYIGSDTPDENIYSFWIETTIGGQPLALKIFYNGSWTDVYAAQLANYLTASAAAATYLTQANAASTYQTIAGMTNYSTVAAKDAGDVATLAAANAYTDAAIGSIPGATPAHAAGATNSSQSVSITGSAVKLNFDTEVFDINGNYDAGNSRYVVPLNGVYQVSAELQVDNVSGAPAGMEMELSVTGGTPLTSGNSSASPPGDRWYPNISGLVAASAGAFLEVTLSLNDGTLSGSVTAANGTFSINLVQAT